MISLIRQFANQFEMSRDAIGALGSIIVGLIYYLLATQLRISALDDSLGAGGLPRIYGVLMMALGVVLLVRSQHRSMLRHQHSVNNSEHTKDTSIGTRPFLRAGGFLLIGVVVVLALEPLGYLLSITLSLSTLSLYLGARLNSLLIVVSVLGAIFLWVLFALVLQVSMPIGVLDLLYRIK